MFKKLKKKVAEDPSLGLSESSGKQTKSVLSTDSSSNTRPTKTLGLSSDDEAVNSKAATSPGSAIRLQDSPAPLTNDDRTSSSAENSQVNHSTPPPENGSSSAVNGASNEASEALQEQLKYLQQLLATAEARQNAAVLERDHSEKQLVELRKQVADFGGYLSESRGKCKSLSDDLSSKEKVLVEREATIAQLRQECANVSSRQSVSEKSLHEASERATRLAADCRSLESNSSDVHEQLQAVKAEKEKLQAAFDADHEELVGSRRDVLTTQEQCRQLQAQLSAQQHLHEEEVNGLRDRLSSINQQMAESDHPDAEQMAALVAQRDEVEKLLSEARKQLADQQATSEEKIGRLEILSREKDSDLTQLRTKLDDVEKSLQSHVSMVKELQGNLKMAETQLESTLSQTEREIERVQSLLVGAESDVQRTKAELQAQKDHSDKAQKENEAQVAQLNEQLASVRSQLADSTMTSSGLVSELESQLAQLHTARDIDKATTGSKLAALRSECSELRQNLTDSRKQVSNAATERALLDADLTAAVASIQNRNQCLVALGKEVGRDIACEVAEASLYSDSDGKLVLKLLSDWQEELRLILNSAKELTSSHGTKCQDLEDESKRLANSLELEQYTARQLQTDLSAAKASLEEATAAASQSNTAAVLTPSSHDNGPVGVRVDSADAAKPALMAQTSSSGLTAELTSLHEQVGRLQEEIAEKNQTVKQQQLLLSDLRKQLQRHLNKPGSSKPLSSASHSDSNTSPSYQQSPLAKKTSNGSKDIGDPVNDIYLKNVILRYMCSSDWEAQHLIKAISTLLRFSPTEEQLVREYLTYKSSWFGAKPGGPPS